MDRKPTAKGGRRNPIRGEVVVGSRLVGPFGIVALSAHVVLFAILAAYTLFIFWPPAVNGHGDGVVRVTAYFAFLPFTVPYEAALLIVVIAAGALGSCIHTLRSLSWYIGNRELRRSWIAKYLMMPIYGSSLALVFYFVVRGGFFSVQATAESANVLGFAALSGMVGLFSDQAVLKLKELAETLLTKPRPGSDAVPQGDNNRSGSDKANKG